MIRVNICENDLKLLFILLSTIISIQVIIGLIQFALPNIFGDFFYTAVLKSSQTNYVGELMAKSQVVIGLVLNKNTFAQILLFLFIILNYYSNTENTKGHTKNKWIEILKIITALNIILSGSRGAMISLIVLLLIYYKNKIKLTYYVLSVLVITFTIFSTNYIDLGKRIHSKQSLINKFYNLVDPAYYESMSKYGRIALWRSTINILDENPFWGVGGSNWGTGLAYSKNYSYKAFQNNNLRVSTGVMQDAGFASTLGQYGLIGFILFLMTVYFPYRRLQQCSQSIKIHHANNIKQLVNNLILIAVIGGLSVPYFSIEPVSLLFWLLFGSCLSHMESLKKTHYSGLGGSVLFPPNEVEIKKIST